MIPLSNIIYICNIIITIDQFWKWDYYFKKCPAVPKKIGDLREMMYLWYGPAVGTCQGKLGGKR